MAFADNVRDTWKKLTQGNPIVVASAALVCIALAVVVAVLTLHRPAAAGSDARMRLKCARPECGAEYVFTAAELSAMPAESDSYGDPSVKCPKCGHGSLVFATVCPKDKTVFIRIPYRGMPTTGPGRGIRSKLSEGRTLVCPTCEWDYVADQRERAKRGDWSTTP